MVFEPCDVIGAFLNKKKKTSNLIGSFFFLSSALIGSCLYGKLVLPWFSSPPAVSPTEYVQTGGVPQREALDTSSLRGEGGEHFMLHMSTRRNTG